MSYMDRALKAKDRRYARILEKLGHKKPEEPAVVELVEEPVVEDEKPKRRRRKDEDYFRADMQVED